MINYSLKTEYEDYSVLEGDAVWSDICLQTFEKNVLPISAEDSSKFMSLLSPFFVLRIATARFSETSVNIYQNT